MNDEWRSGWALEGGGCKVHDVFSTIMSIAFLPAAPSFFQRRVFVGRMRTVSTQRDSKGSEDEDAVVTERDFSRFPGGFVAVMGVLPVEAN